MSVNSYLIIYQLCLVWIIACKKVLLETMENRPILEIPFLNKSSKVNGCVLSFCLLDKWEVFYFWLLK